MIIRLEQPFIETLKQFGESFSVNDKQRLVEIIDSKYDTISFILKEQENSEIDFDPKVVDLGEIDRRIYTLNLYKTNDPGNDDIPLEITQMLPTISPVRMDIMSTLNNQSKDNNSTYLKVGQIYDDGDVHSKYVDEVMEEERID